MKNKVFITRTFYPVGQGAFYCEKICSEKKEHIFTMVYDCGTSNKQIIVRKCVDRCFSKDKIIDALFISHFDKDHISGIKYLLDTCNVKNIYIPYLTSEIKFIFNFYFWKNNKLNSFECRFLNNPGEIVKKDNLTKVYYITNDEIQKNTEDDINIINSNSISKCKQFSVLNNYDWIYKPYNWKHNSKEISKLVDTIKNKLHIKNIRDFIHLDNKVYYQEWDYISNELKKIYKDVCDYINNTSIVLYSGSNTNFDIQHLSDCQFINNKCISCKTFNYKLCKNNDCHNCIYKISNPLCLDKSECMKKMHSGCLYTGDISLKKQCIVSDIINFYSNYLNDIAVLQVPHHGSANNAPNSNFFQKFNFKHYVISAGGATHPTKSLVKLYERFGLVHTVTSCNLSELTFIIEY